MHVRRFLASLNFSDEAHFNLSGCVNDQRMNYCSLDNPKNFTTFTTLSRVVIIGLWFIEENERAISVNFARYVRIIHEVFLPSANDCFGAILHHILISLSSPPWRIFRSYPAWLSGSLYIFCRKEVATHFWGLYRHQFTQRCDLLFRIPSYYRGPFPGPGFSCLEC